jgi:KAP family P-loop domain
MIGRMDEPQNFAALRSQGLSAYERFHGLVTDPRALAQWRAGAEGAQLEMIVEFTRRTSQLPPPAGDLPLSIVANVAAQASIGSLRDHQNLASVTGRLDEAGPLDEWYSTVLTQLQRLAPEALQSDILWTGYTPGFSTDLLADRAVRYATHVAPERSHAGPFAVLLVLLRDWAHELEPWMAQQGFTIDSWIWNLTELAPKDETDFESWTDFADDVVVPRDAFDALARLDELRPLALPQAGIAAEVTQEEPTPDTPPTPPTPPTPRVEHAARPSTTVSSDLSTDEDQLEYALYADAIASFIRDERTRAPLTIGIKAPWGAGKTSLMKMIRKRLDPNPPRPRADAPRLKIKDLWRQTRHKSPEEAADALEPEHLETGERRTTIWFNAWKYQSGEQLWAGLAHAILAQASDRLEPVDRDRLWASLQLRRVSTDQVRRRFYGYVGMRLIPWAIAVPVAALIVAVIGLIDASAVPGASIIGGIVVVGGAIASTVRAGWDEVAKATPQLVRAPDYESRLGFLHLVDTDMRRILEVAGATAERPFVVFVDDLDRCSYTTVAQVIEALNVFLAGDFDNCIFVIAMEPDLVAAQIHVAYEKLFEQLDDRGDDLGWRFLEKMVQLPLSLPEPQAPQVERFLDSILAIETEQRIAEIADDAPEVVQARERIQAAETTGTLEGVGDAYEEVRKSYATQGVRGDAIVQKAARLEFADRFDDSTARDMLLRFAKDLSGNPREIKRFVNVFRFYAYIDFWRRTQGLETPGLDGAGKLARLAIGWPSLLSALATDVSVNGISATLLQALETTPDGEWQDIVVLAPVRARGQLDKAALRDVIRGEPHIGAAASSFL